MKLTRALLKARRLDLEQQKSGVLADLHALDGALQQVDWSLAKLKEDETTGDEREEDAQDS